jgi:2-hydroxychromene-2-carboxylate isomerase
MNVAAPIEFYFDFSSPYGYLASTKIDELAARFGSEAAWRPFLLGVVFKTTGQSPLTEQPMRAPYSLHDFTRSARLLGVPFRMPEPFPFPSQAACRAVYWAGDRDPAKGKALANAIYHAAFGDGRDVRSPEAVVAIAASIGIDGDALSAALDDPVVKERLKTETEAAMKRGVFGSPFIFVDGEPFWGHDRLGQVERWLETGGW